MREQLNLYVAYAEYFSGLRERGFDICRPSVLPKEERRMNVRNARNPLVVEAKENGKRVVPNDISHSPDSNMLILTGPNNGGKTTYVKTVGLIQLLAQKGFYVPAESAEVSFADGIFTHFVAPDDITKGEGRYRNELRRVKDIFGKATPYSLIILDEPCGGTDNEEGIRQSLEILEGFHILGSPTYFTTHMHPITREAGGRLPAARNLQVEVLGEEGERLRYTYRVIPGSSGKSYGLAIGREFGLEAGEIERQLRKRAKQQKFSALLRKRGKS